MSNYVTFLKLCDPAPALLNSINQQPGICDGAAAVMIASEEAVKEHNLTPLARWVEKLFSHRTSHGLCQPPAFRIVGYGVAGCEPTIMGIGPVPSIQVV